MRSVAFLLDRGIAVAQGIQRLRRALPDILGTNAGRLSPRMVRIIEALASDWCRFDERIDEVSAEIETLARKDIGCEQLMTVPGIGPIISSATVATIGSGDMFAKGRDFGAWLGMVPKQISTGGRPHVERQAWAAYHGEHFRRAAARIFSQQVLAHVRRATVGTPKIENTHPFVDGPWTFIHNGTIRNFDRLRPQLLAQLPQERRKAIHGDTDSEHVFHYLRHLQTNAPHRPLLDVLRDGLRQIVEWCREIEPTARVSLNVILTDGEQMVGSRLGRTLYYVEREGVHDCEICGFPHIHHDPHRRYRAVVVASEPISHEDWREVPERSVYRVNEHFRLETEPL